MKQRQDQTKKTNYSNIQQERRTNLIRQSTTSVQSSQYKEYSDQEVKDIFYKEEMDRYKEDLVWNEDAQRFFVKDENGKYMGEYKVADLRKLAKDATEKQVTPEYITRYKELNKRQTDIKRNKQRRKSQNASSYQRINTILETKRQRLTNIDEKKAKIKELNRESLELNKEMLEHTKYLYKIDSKAAEQVFTADQRTAENILAVEQAERSVIQAIDTRDNYNDQQRITRDNFNDQQRITRDNFNDQQRINRDLQVDIFNETMKQQNAQQRINRDLQVDIFNETMKNQSIIAGEQNALMNEFLGRQNDLSNKLNDGLSDLTATIRDNAATNAAAMKALGDQQADAAAKAQKTIEAAIAKSNTPPKSPDDIRRFCRDACPNSYKFIEYRVNATNRRTNQTGITIWRCEAGGHYCASDAGPIDYFDRGIYGL